MQTLSLIALERKVNGNEKVLFSLVNYWYTRLNCCLLRAIATARIATAILGLNQRILLHENNYQLSDRSIADYHQAEKDQML